MPLIRTNIPQFLDPLVERSGIGLRPGAAVNELLESPDAPKFSPTEIYWFNHRRDMLVKMARAYAAPRSCFLAGQQSRFHAFGEGAALNSHRA
jgi:hypothetical protein